MKGNFMEDKTKCKYQNICSEFNSQPRLVCSINEFSKIFHTSCNIYLLYEQNIKLRKALKDCISENCYYHEEECNMCTIGLLGQCKIPEAAKLLEECSLPYIQLKGRCER